jgi:hypothetical protein
MTVRYRHISNASLLETVIDAATLPSQTSWHCALFYYQEDRVNRSIIVTDELMFIIIISRASEILFSFADLKLLERNTTSQYSRDDLFAMLITVRRNLGIFQHHDGVTGTARDHVVNDYGRKYIQKRNFHSHSLLFYLY